MFRVFLSELARVYRESSELCKFYPVGQSNAVGKTLPEKAHLKVKLENFSEGTGQVRCVGDVEEIFTFAGNGQLVGAFEFSRLDWVYTTGLADEEVVGTLIVETSTSDGQPVVLPYLVGEYRTRVDTPSMTRETELYGVLENLRARLYFNKSADVCPGDTIAVGQTTFSVIRVESPVNRFTTHHLEVYCS